MLDGGFVRITDAAREYGQDGAHERLASQFVITQPGYVYIYLSNDNAASGGQQVEVYFDDFKVEQAKSSVVQMDDYYPFGLTFNSYSRENRVPNMYQYNGKENQDELNLRWLDYGARMYAPEIGRWLGVDLLAHRYDNSTPYAYCKNNPILFLDPNGMEVKNEATERRKKAELAVKDYKNAVTALSKNGTRRKDFATKAEFKRYKEYNHKLKDAKRDLKVAISDETSTHKLISSLKVDSPNLFNKLDNLKNEHGETVDVYLTATRNPEGPNDGVTLMGFEETKIAAPFTGPSIFRPTSAYGVNTIQVQVSTHPSGGRSMSEVAKHEAGHVDYQAENTAAYRHYLQKNNRLNSSYDGHASDDPSGQRADSYTHIKDIQ